MISSFQTGKFYYLKVDCSQLEIEPDNYFSLWFDVSQNEKPIYRINGGGWQSDNSGTGVFSFYYTSGNGFGYKTRDDVNHPLTDSDVIEIYAYLTHTPILDDVNIPIIMKTTLESPLTIETWEMEDEKNVVHKTNYSIHDILFGVLREECDVLNPSILLELDEFPIFNYVYIKEYLRYYFVTGITIVRKNLFRIDLHVDVLNTYRDDIYLQNAFISRSESTTDGDIVDERVPLENVPTISFNTSIGNSGGSSLVNTEWVYDNDVTPSNYFCIAFSVINDLAITSGGQPAIKPSGTTLPSIRRSVGDNPLMMTYCLDFTYLRYAMDTIKASSSLASYVGGVVAFPFKIYDDVILNSGGYVLVWNFNINTTLVKDDNNVGITTTALKGESSKYYIIADFTISETHSGYLKFLNYEPYTRYELYIPFKGWISLPTMDVTGSRNIVYYVVDYVTGDGSVYVYNVTKNKMVYSSPVQIGIKIGVSTTNVEELTKQKQSNALNLMLGLIGSSTSIGIGLASGNPIGIIGGVLSGSHAIANAVNNNRMLLERANCSISGDKMGLYGGYKPILKKITYALASNFNQTKFKKVNGYKINAYDDLSSFSGYTEIPNLRYKPSNDTNITSTEIDEIISLARDGIIL